MGVEQPAPVYHAPAPAPVWVEQPAPVYHAPAPVPAGPSHKELKALKKQAKAAKHAAKKAAKHAPPQVVWVEQPVHAPAPVHHAPAPAPAYHAPVPAHPVASAASYGAPPSAAFGVPPPAY